MAADEPLQPIAVFLEEPPSSPPSTENAEGAACSHPLHSLPCHIDYTGPARVSTFFRPEMLNDGVTKVAAFRGHLLLGQTIELPKGYKFYTVSEEEKQPDDGINEGEGNGPKIFKVQSVSSSLDYWEYDELPGANKKNLKSALAVLRVAEDLAL